MRKKDSLDVLNVLLALLGDSAAVFGGFALATWARFDSGLFPIWRDRPPSLYTLYLLGAAFAVVLFLVVFNALGLYARPQTGSYASKIPRLVRSCFVGIMLTTVLAFSVKNAVADYSRLVIGLSFAAVTVLVLLERYLLFRVEWNMARHSPLKNDLLIVGTDAVAARLRRSLQREPMLRLRVAGFLRVGAEAVDDAIRPEEVLGSADDLPAVVARRPVHRLVLTHSHLSHQQIVDLIVWCEQNLIAFNMVPDLFRILTGEMDVQSIDDIPLLGLRHWPLDHIGNRMIKRAEDVAGAVFGLLVFAPVIAAAAAAVKLTSPGPVFYSQERCGRNGRTFRLHKLRTMRVDAEAASGPVFTAENDPRVTRVGAFLRRHNVDEFPQLWNVLRGQMSLVGPRPERPHFVEKFKTGIAHYMSRHASKPGMTGWAQVNGLRGNTSIEERIKYDLYYLENWSVSLDFKILLRTVFARENAY